MRLRKRLISVAVIAMLGLPTIGAQASLLLIAPEDFSGTGLGAVNTILTMQSPASTSFESASVGLDGSGTEVITGDALTGASQTQVRSISTLGLTSAANLRVVFNGIEPGNPAEDSISVDDLVLNIYSPTGTVLFSSGVFVPILFPDTFQGAGNSGFVFGLDPLQAAAAQASAFTGIGFGNNLIGISATASFATGGPETIFVANTAVPIPESETYLMMLAGLGLMSFIARRRKQITA